MSLRTGRAAVFNLRERDDETTGGGRSRNTGRGPEAHAIGSTYRPSTRRLTCTPRSKWARPAVPTGSPRAIRSPTPTASPRRSRCDTLTLKRPLAIVTESTPATDPANDTTPSMGAPTGAPAGTARSTPQCPAKRPSGANGAVTGPGSTTTQDSTNAITGSPLPHRAAGTVRPGAVIGKTLLPASD